MKKTITNLLWACCLGCLLWSCGDEKENSVYQIFNDNPASTMLDKDENFSEWVKVLRYADLYNALNQATQAFTLFVPDNSAVLDFYAKKGKTLEELGPKYARAMVLHHTFLDSIKVETMQLKSSLENLNGDLVSVEIDSVNPGQFVFGGVSHTTQTAVHAYNALMYYVDELMTPLVESVYEKMLEDGNYTIMAEAIAATAWDKQINVVFDTIPLPTGGTQISRRSYTLLAVTDEAFQRDQIHSLQDLVAKLSAGSDYTEPTNALNEYVAYHILPGSYTLADFFEVMGDTTRIWETEADNQVLMTTVDTLSGTCLLNALDSTIVTTQFVADRSDVLAKNGYLHQLDAYLPIWEPDPSTVVWDLASYAEVRNAVVSELGFAEYQPSEPVASEKKVDVTRSGAYEVEISEAGVVGKSYAYVTYVNCKKLLKECTNHDRMAFNVGYMGSVSMKTPTIVRGKYRVDLKFVYLSDHNFMRQMSDGNGGMIKMTFDGEHQKSAIPYTTVPKSTAGVYTATLYDEIEFEQTMNHQFKFVVMDPSASTNAKFSLQFDCIIFTPIE